MTTRRLAAVLAADVVGFSAMMERDEEGTLARIQALRREVMEPSIEAYHGRLVKTTGDGFLAEFASAVEAVKCAVRVQERIAALDVSGGTAPLRLRIGVNLGDILVGGDGDIYGDGVNIAARLEQIAPPGGLCISGAVFDQIDGKLNLTFKNRGEQRVKNIARPVRIYDLDDEGSPQAGAAPVPLSIPDRPSVAVLPFTNASPDPDQDHFAQGIVEEVTAALSRVRSFFVISPSSTSAYKGKSVDPREASRVLGVRYVVEGSIRRSGSRLRVMARLIDAATGNHVWSERYDGEVSDIFDLQDRVAEAVVGAIEPTITLSEIERARRKRPENLDAYECAMRAFPSVWSQDPEQAAEALRLAQRAAALDPNYPLPKALAAWCYAQRVTYMRTSDAAEDRATALRLAQEAATLDNNDPLVLTVLSAAYGLVGEFSLALATIEKALAIDPNSAWAWLRSGWSHHYAGEPDMAIEHFARSMRLSPLDPMRFNALVGIGASHFGKGEYEEAIRWIERGQRERPDAVWTYRLLTAAYAHAGRRDEARRAAAKFLDAYPGMTVSRAIDTSPPSAPAIELIAEGLRKAGLPE